MHDVFKSAAKVVQKCETAKKAASRRAENCFLEDSDVFSERISVFGCQKTASPRIGVERGRVPSETQTFCTPAIVEHFEFLGCDPRIPCGGLVKNGDLNINFFFHRLRVLVPCKPAFTQDLHMICIRRCFCEESRNDIPS